MNTGTPTNIYDLPNEILHFIVGFTRNVAKERTNPAKADASYSLSLVSRRLREFAFPLLIYDLTIRSEESLYELVDNFNSSPKLREFAACVR